MQAKYRRIKIPTKISISFLDLKIKKQLCKIWHNLYNNQINLDPDIEKCIMDHFWEYI